MQVAGGIVVRTQLYLTEARRRGLERLAREAAGRPQSALIRDAIDRLLAASPRIGDYVEPSEVRRYVAEHLAGDRNHEKTLWMLLALEMWLETLGASSDARADS